MIEKKILIKPHAQWIKYFYRWISYYIGLVLLKLPVTPNFITIIRIPIVCYASFLIISNNTFDHYLSAFLLFNFSFFDALDGTVAQMKNKHSMMGRWLDPQTDRFGMLIIFSFVSYRLFLENADFISTWLTMTTMIMYYHRGMLISDISYKPKFVDLKNYYPEKINSHTRPKNQSKTKKTNFVFSFLSQLFLQTAPHTHNVIIYLIIGLLFDELLLLIAFLNVYFIFWYLYDSIKIVKKIYYFDRKD